MSNQIAAGKKRINVVLREEQIKRLDARAVELGTTRAALVSQAVDALLDGAPERDRAEAKLDAIAAKLDAMDGAQRLAAAGVLEAVRSQPIAVQQLAAPFPGRSQGSPGRIQDKGVRRAAPSARQAENGVEQAQRF